MNRQTEAQIEKITNFMNVISSEDKAIRIRTLNTGFDLFKSSAWIRYRGMTVGEFLEAVASLENIARPLVRLSDTVISIMSQGVSTPAQKVIPTPLDMEDFSSPRMLPLNEDAPFFEQVAEVIDTLIKGLSTLNDSYKKGAICLSLGFEKGMNDDRVAEAENRHRERIRQIRTNFQKGLLNGRVPEELVKEYAIKDSFNTAMSDVISSISRQGVGAIRKHTGNVCESKVIYILKMLGFRNSAFIKSYLGSLSRDCRISA